MKNTRIFIFLLLISVFGGFLLISNNEGLIISPITESQAEEIEISAVMNDLLWNVTWGGSSADAGTGVVLDTMGNLYCVGRTESFGAGDSDLALVKFSPEGTRLWNVTWGGLGWDSGSEVVVDAAGNLYCIGETTVFGTGNSDFALIKFYSNGTLAWSTTWGGALRDETGGIALDLVGNLYCIGRTESFGAGSFDLALIKFSPNGTRLWNVTWGGFEWDSGIEVIVDPAGNLYCVGYTGNLMAWEADLALVNFSPNGTRLWNVTWGGLGLDAGLGVVADAAGDLYCVGVIDDFTADSDLALVKFSPNGTRLWNVTWGGPSRDLGWEVVMDAAGDLYCVGSTESDFALIKFSPTGTQLWNLTWGGSLSDEAWGIALDAAGNLYCVGRTESFGAGSFDLVLIKVKLVEISTEIPGFGWFALFQMLIAILISKKFSKFYKILSF